MGSSTQSAGTTASPEFIARFRLLADADGTMSFARFMELALYDSSIGYYRRNRRRIGYQSGTDFFTASTSGAVFGELVAAACAKLLRDAGRDPHAHTFVEIGAEPETGGVLQGVAHPFAGVQLVGLGDPAAIAGHAVVFSNELFDAQPFERTVFRNGAWHELRVRLDADRLLEVAVPYPGDPVAAPGDNYHFDRPRAAARLADSIAAQGWRGLFVACDYGKTLRELREDTPAGTARAYHRHTQSNDLLARPGEQDLTCHVCWDWLEESLRGRNFDGCRLEFQETFFIRHAGDYIAAASAADAAGFSRRKMSLLQLLHPAHLGQKFQVFHALR